MLFLHQFPEAISLRFKNTGRPIDLPATRLGRTASSMPVRRPQRGMTLVEVMIATSLFTLMALGALATLLQTRRMSENNLAQATAAVIVQGIIEQVHLDGYTTITTDPNLVLTFTAPNSSNLSTIQQFSLPWATDATTFTEIGIRTDPADLTSPILGVLIDLDYRNGSTVIRPARYMKMRVNLQRNVHTTDDNVEIILTYSWQPPSGNGAASAPYLTREIRTIRSPAQSF